MSLRGTLTVLLINGFSPVLNDTFNILDWGSLSGTFGTVSLPSLSEGLEWDQSQLYTHGKLVVTAVPEASTLALFALGGLVCLWVQRRGKKRI
jgi:hypothetical protein